MSYYEYDTGYYEPSELDVLLEEYEDKMKSILLGSVQQEIKSLRKENAELKEKEKGFADKEKDLENKANNLKRELENEFYNKTVTKNLEKVLDTIDVYYAGTKYKQDDKCCMCNNDRMLVAKFNDGTEQYKKCKCATKYNYYSPMVSTNKVLEIYQRKGSHNYPRRFVFKSSHSANPRDDYDYSYNKFELTYFFDKFGEDVKETHKNKEYSEKLAFYNEKACQEYCDWLNEKINRTKY